MKRKLLKTFIVKSLRAQNIVYCIFHICHVQNVNFSLIYLTKYTFSVRPTIPESENLQMVMVKIDEEENKILSLRTLFSAKEIHFCHRREPKATEDGIHSFTHKEVGQTSHNFARARFSI